MDGLEFITAPPAAAPDPVRADIACFIGWVGRRGAGSLQEDRARLGQALNQLGWQGPGLELELAGELSLLPAYVQPQGDSPHAFANWLEGLGWGPPAMRDPLAPAPTRAQDLFVGLLGLWFDPVTAAWFKDRGLLDPAAGYSAVDVLELRDLPTPIDNWNAFNALFAWNARPVPDAQHQASDPRLADTSLGAAVRSFFRQGGRKCYLVRLGDPLPVFSSRAERAGMPGLLLPNITPTPADRRTWRGVGNLLGVPEVSFLCLPDVPELFAVNTQPLPPQTDSTTPERFVECAGRTEPPSFQSLRTVPSPRCDAAGFGLWAGFVDSVGQFIVRLAQTFQPREVQFIAAVPLPVNEASLESDPAILALVGDERRLGTASRISVARAAQWNVISARLQSAFIQLTYPWLDTLDSAALAGGLEPPDGTLAGLLANMALTQGAWRTPARQAVPGLRAVEPVLTREELERPLPSGGNQAQGDPRTVRERITVFGPTAIGLRLLSDVTTAGDEAWRPAGVNRLMNVIVRAARRAGEAFVFTNSGPRLWRQVVNSISRVLTQLWAAGALDGTTPAQAFEVRCDRSTMSQTDLDAGRLIVRVQFTAAAPIERIVAVLAMSEGGQVSLISAGNAAPATAQQEAA